MQLPKVILKHLIRFLLEELLLKEKAEKAEITISYNAENDKNYKLDLLLSKLENVEGVNALAENQSIEFSPNLTIIYGANGSGKSGYVRLLKNVFYTKPSSKEEILPNVHGEDNHKPINAKFTFASKGTLIPLMYADKSKPEFQQFAVFDGKSVLSHLEHRNEFEFRPAGLSFFGEYTTAILKVEQKLNTDIQSKRTPNDFALWFDGDSEIKTLVGNLSAATKIESLKKYTPFSDEDKAQKIKIQKQYDELLLASRNKEGQIKQLETTKKLLVESKASIEQLNKYFTKESIAKVNSLITDFIDKEAIAKSEGIENFKTDKIEGVGTKEWKNFILAADVFAKNQKQGNTAYPEVGDNCLLCHQPLLSDAEKLVATYWKFIRSAAEENATRALEVLEKAKQVFEKLNFDLYPENNTLTVWLSENHSKILETLKHKLAELKTLCDSIVTSFRNRTITNQIEIKVDTEVYQTIVNAIEVSIKTHQQDEQNLELGKLLIAKTFLDHKEKLNIHFSKFENYISNLVWIKNASKADFAKRRITDTEKALSSKYFNQKYIDTFNEECAKLNGNFGIEISHTGAAGKSYRQLRLKGRNPNAILSEGEQKVIVIADFIAEMQLSEVNRGIIFDDPVTSLDNDRKKQIAECLANSAINKQVIIFTHDLVFFYHIKNFGKKYLNSILNSFVHHSLEKDNVISGKVILNSSPATEAQYNEPRKAEEWLRKSKTANGNTRMDYAKAGFSALRSSYEALAIFTILGSTVQRFDPQIRMGRLKEIKYDKSLTELVVEKHGEISDLIEGHLPNDEFGIIPSPELLEIAIVEFKNIKERIKKL